MKLKAVYRILVSSAETRSFQHGFQLAPPRHVRRHLRHPRHVRRQLGPSIYCSPRQPGAKHILLATSSWGQANTARHVIVGPSKYCSPRHHRFKQNIAYHVVIEPTNTAHHATTAPINTVHHVIQRVGNPRLLTEMSSLRWRALCTTRYAPLYFKKLGGSV